MAVATAAGVEDGRGAAVFVPHGRGRGVGGAVG